MKWSYYTMRSAKSQRGNLASIYPRGIIIVWSWSIRSISTQSTLQIIPVFVGLIGAYVHSTIHSRTPSSNDISGYLSILWEYVSFVIAPSLILIQSLAEWWITTGIVWAYLLAGTYKTAMILSAKQRWWVSTATWIPLMASAVCAIIISYLLIRSMLDTWIAIIIIGILSRLTYSPAILWTRSKNKIS